jgi:hypothetical protein
VARRACGADFLLGDRAGVRSAAVLRLVSVNPPAGTYIAFDGCAGVIVLKSFSAPPTTTTSTIPPTAF